jgi:hypothetical protein
MDRERVGFHREQSEGRYYRLTEGGRKALGTETESWRRYVSAVEWVLGTS